jgi:hypothetical protein
MLPTAKKNFEFDPKQFLATIGEGTEGRDFSQKATDLCAGGYG